MTIKMITTRLALEAFAGIASSTILRRLVLLTALVLEVTSFPVAAPARAESAHVPSETLMAVSCGWTLTLGRKEGVWFVNYRGDAERSERQYGQRSYVYNCQGPPNTPNGSRTRYIVEYRERRCTGDVGGVCSRPSSWQYSHYQYTPFL